MLEVIIIMTEDQIVTLSVMLFVILVNEEPKKLSQCPQKIILPELSEIQNCLSILSNDLQNLPYTGLVKNLPKFT